MQISNPVGALVTDILQKSPTTIGLYWASSSLASSVITERDSYVIPANSQAIVSCFRVDVWPTVSEGNFKGGILSVTPNGGSEANVEELGMAYGVNTVGEEYISTTLHFLSAGDEVHLNSINSGSNTIILSMSVSILVFDS